MDNWGRCAFCDGKLHPPVFVKYRVVTDETTMTGDVSNLCYCNEQCANADDAYAYAALVTHQQQRLYGGQTSC